MDARKAKDLGITVKNKKIIFHEKPRNMKPYLPQSAQRRARRGKS